MKKIYPASIHTKDVAGLAQSVELLTGEGEVEESIPGTESKLKFFKKNEKLRYYVCCKRLDFCVALVTA